MHNAQISANINKFSYSLLDLLAADGWGNRRPMKTINGTRWSVSLDNTKMSGAYALEIEVVVKNRDTGETTAVNHSSMDPAVVLAAIQAIAK